MVFGARNEKEKRNKGRGEEAREETREEEARQEAGPRTIPLFSLSLSPPLKAPSLSLLLLLLLILSFLPSFLSFPFPWKKKKVSLSQPVRDAMREPDIRAKVILPPSSPTLLRSFKQLCTTNYDNQPIKQPNSQVLIFFFFLYNPNKLSFLLFSTSETRSKFTSRFCISLSQYLNSLK